MTYTVKTTMPDGNVPDLPNMPQVELIEYLTNLGAPFTEPLPDSGITHATYLTPNDTTIQWDRNDDDE